MSDDDLDYIEHCISRNISYEHLFVSFYGGEALLEKKTVRRLIHMLDSMHTRSLYKQVYTNGLLLTESMIHFLSSLEINCLQISLDTERVEQRNYKKTLIDNILTAKNSNINIILRINVTHESNDFLEKILPSISKIKNSVFCYFAPIMSCPDDHKHASSTSKIVTYDEIKLRAMKFAWNKFGIFTVDATLLPKDIPCYLLRRNSLIIGPNLEGYCCHRHVGDSDSIYEYLPGTE